MKWLASFKLVVLVLSILILLPVCSTINENNSNEPYGTHGNQITSTSTGDEVTLEKTESKLFADISKYTIENPKAYSNDEFKLSVDYPAEWEVSIDGKSSPDLPDGDPQRGISIYVESNKNDLIYVYHQFGHIGLLTDGFTSENFTTTAGVKGKILYQKSQENIKIYLVLGDAFNGAIIKMSETSFQKNKGQILGILKSIKIAEFE